MKNPDEIAQLEKLIAQKYGTTAVENPRKNWSPEKERKYIRQSKKEQEKNTKVRESQDKVEQDGFLINKKLLNKDHNRTCPVCKRYSFQLRDDMYMSKFGSCFTCYIHYIDGREERWATGWRPHKEE